MSQTFINMEKLLMCRICLREEVPMQSIVDTHLEAMYESLTLMSFETKDNRPDEVCDICCEKLQNCFQLWKRCLRSEELFTRILNSNVAPAESQDILRLHTPTETAELHLNMGGVEQNHADSAVRMDCQEDLDDVEMKMEDSEVSGDELLKEDDIESEEDAQSSFAEDDLTSEQDTQSSFEEDDLFLPVTYQEPTDVPTSGPNPWKPTPAATNSEDLTTNSFKEIEDLDVKHKTETITKLPESHDKDNLCKERSNQASSAITNIAKGKFVSAISLEIDVPIRTHTGDKLYQCDVCKKCFIQKRILIKHIRRHNGKKSYDCNYCKKIFSIKNCVNIHFGTQYGELPYKCNK